MRLLPECFNDLARLAAQEVYLRGVGEHKEYDYSVHTVVAVAFLWDAAFVRQGTIPVDADLKALTPRKQAKNLLQAWCRFYQSQPTTQGPTT